MDDNCAKGRIGITENLLHFFCESLVTAEKALDFETKPIRIGLKETRLERNGSELLDNPWAQFEG
jgi:hypothetical protein